MDCKARAVLIVTRSVAGTTTNVASRRVELHCKKPSGHSGKHADPTEGEEWDCGTHKLETVLRHESGDEGR